jgi:L-aspartate oxidase
VKGFFYGLKCVYITRIFLPENFEYDSVNLKRIHTDCLVIGSGAAGLYAALHACKYGSVTVVSKSVLSESSSYYAQGGVAAVLHADDSTQRHIQDTFLAGRKAGSPNAIETLVTEGTEDVLELIALGMEFDKKNGEFDLGLEGGHSFNRILHKGGASTGKALIEFLSGLLLKCENSELLEESFACNLITDEHQNRCYGADIYRYKKNELLRIHSRAVILASGGYSGLYSRSTNPHTSTCDGLWLAQRAGVPLKNLEFVQFHPTAFYSPTERTFLISEALRGEGARLVNTRGERFMSPFSGRELAPRDVVAREIFRQIEMSDDQFVSLDLRHLDAGAIRKKYPALIAEIEKRGFNIDRDLIPVAPAAHYCIGGVETDLLGSTKVNGLYACGETAHTGVHGANRLASNSLLECLVFGRRAARHAASQYGNTCTADQLNGPDFSLTIHPDSAKSCMAVLTEVSEILNRCAGVVRDRNGLTKALNELSRLREVNAITADETELYHMKMAGALTIAEQIVNAALNREKSLGVHNRSDDEGQMLKSMETKV